MLLATQCDLHAGESEHCAGSSHTWCDDLSRGITPRELGIPENLCFDFAADPLSSEVLRLCNPHPDLEIVDGDTFWLFWGEARSLASLIKQGC